MMTTTTEDRTAIGSSLSRLQRLCGDIRDSLTRHDALVLDGDADAMADDDVVADPKAVPFATGPKETIRDTAARRNHGSMLGSPAAPFAAGPTSTSVESAAMRKNFSKSFANESVAAPSRQAPMPSGSPAYADADMGPRSAASRRFAPMQQLTKLSATLRPACRIDALTLPAVAHQVLDDCQDNWHRLADAILELNHSQGLRAVMTCSSLPGEGCSTVTLCLLASLAERIGEPMLLMESDLARPSLAKSLCLPATCGMEGVLVDGEPWENALVQVGRSKLYIMGVANGFAYPQMAMQDARMGQMMESLRAKFGLILIDGGNAFAGNSPGLLCDGVDAALLVRDPQTSSDYLLEQLDRYLEDRHISSLGVIENFVE